MSLIDEIKRDREAGTPMHYTAERNHASVCAEGWAIVYDPTPGGRKNGDGSTSYSLRFPALLVSGLVSDPEGAARELADNLQFKVRAGAPLLVAEECDITLEEVASAPIERSRSPETGEEWVLMPADHWDALVQDIERVRAAYRAATCATP